MINLVQKVKYQLQFSQYYMLFILVFDPDDPEIIGLRHVLCNYLHLVTEPSFLTERLLL